MKNCLFTSLLSIILCVSVDSHSTEIQSSYPYLSGNTFREYCDFIYEDIQCNMDPAQVLKGNTIYVRGGLLRYFFQKVHPKIKYPYILLTHNSNYPVPGDFINYLYDGKIIAWFAVHIKGFVHPKIHPIPDGLPNLKRIPGNTRVWDSIRSQSGNISKSILLYMNFDLKTSPAERQHVYNLFIDKPWCTYSPKKEYASYADDLAHAKFVLSPKGVSLDCYRIWESLLAGSIPIVKSSYLDPLFDELPVLIIDDWSILTEEFLERTYSEMILKSYNTDKMFADYWFALIDAYKTF